LNQANIFNLSRGTLRLFSGRRLVAEFRQRTVMETLPATDRPEISDRKWILQDIKGSPIPKVEKAAFINFDPVKGSAGGDTSCNVFGGKFKIMGDKFQFSEGISTMRACIEDARMDIEREFLAGLRNANRFEIDGDTLMLYRGGDLLLTFSGTKK
jgi:heat shock protein HslJ